ncbi:MAG: PEP-CTERM sorting domain-containing protein [Phycisphaerae bacterium]
MLGFRSFTLMFVVAALVVSPTAAQDWSSVDYVKHSQYQAVDSDGSDAYDGGWPIRMVGVVLNDTEDWLNPAPDFDSGYTPWYMGGEAEIFVQAVDLDGTGWDPFESEPFDDFGGTACWIGQNYGNHGMYGGDSDFSYTDAEWTAELGRLNFQGGDGVTDPIRAGDLVEVRARAGLHYQGKMNVNEQHSKDPAKDFEVVRLVSGFGMPEAAELTLADLKDGSDTFYFDQTRQTGGERYQSTWIELKDLYLQDGNWVAQDYVNFTDDDGRTIRVRLGYADGYDWGELGGQWSSLFGDDPVSVTGILNQADAAGTGGYYLLALDPDHFVPEPLSMSLLAFGGTAVLLRRR